MSIMPFYPPTRAVANEGAVKATPSRLTTHARMADDGFSQRDGLVAKTGIRAAL